MRYYLDTNILIFLLISKADICQSVKKLFEDYENRFYASTICIKELLYLHKVGKFKCSALTEKSLFHDLFAELEKMEIQIVGVTKKYLQKMAELPVDKKQNGDANDYLIVAQAISDKANLISSDSDFARFKDYGLNFVFNKR